MPVLVCSLNTNTVFGQLCIAVQALLVYECVKLNIPDALTEWHHAKHWVPFWCDLHNSHPKLIDAKHVSVLYRKNTVFDYSMS